MNEDDTDLRELEPSDEDWEPTQSDVFWNLRMRELDGSLD